jgi:hypothetical protein
MSIDAWFALVAEEDGEGAEGAEGIGIISRMPAEVGGMASGWWIRGPDRLVAGDARGGGNTWEELCAAYIREHDVCRWMSRPILHERRTEAARTCRLGTGPALRRRE